MIYEIRTYDIGPGNLAEVEKRFGEGYEHRKKYSPLTAFWHTEVGPLNEIIHVWGYKDLAERASVRAAAAKDGNWPPKISEFIRGMNVLIVNAFDFVPTPTPGKMGPFFEIRYYKLKAGTLPDTAKRWEGALPARIKMSPVVLAGGTEFGDGNGFVHIWAYNDLNQRMKVRGDARAQGIWPPPGGGNLISQETKIVMPSAFSPLQ